MQLQTQGACGGAGKPVPAPKAASDLAKLLKREKAWMLKTLASYGIQEPGLIVARMRKPRRGIVGYYSGLSQFRGGARIAVDVQHILDQYTRALDIETELRKTLVHEYGHIIAEAIRELPRLSGGKAVFQLPDWKPVFAGDEEEFAEDLARFCVTFESIHEDFWEEFLAQYGKETQRLYFQETAVTAS